MMHPCSCPVFSPGRIISHSERCVLPENSLRDASEASGRNPLLGVHDGTQSERRQKCLFTCLFRCHCRRQALVSMIHSDAATFDKPTTSDKRFLENSLASFEPHEEPGPKLLPSKSAELPFRSHRRSSTTPIDRASTPENPTSFGSDQAGSTVHHTERDKPAVSKFRLQALSSQPVRIAGMCSDASKVLRAGSADPLRVASQGTASFEKGNLLGVSYHRVLPWSSAEVVGHVWGVRPSSTRKRLSRTRSFLHGQRHSHLDPK